MRSRLEEMHLQDLGKVTDGGGLLLYLLDGIWAESVLWMARYSIT